MIKKKTIEMHLDCYLSSNSHSVKYVAELTIHSCFKTTQALAACRPLDVEIYESFCFT